jgi:hypothetical protein
VKDSSLYGRNLLPIRHLHHLLLLAHLITFKRNKLPLPLPEELQGANILKSIHSMHVMQCVSKFAGEKALRRYAGIAHRRNNT